MSACKAVRFPALATLAVAAALGCVPALAQVFKCVDRGGHVTYQQSPCAGAQGGPIELVEPLQARPGASSEKSEQLWHAAARDGRAVVGMPKPFVTQGLGSPSEIRAPRNGETGSEVWVYPKGGQVTRIGFQNNAVAWVRADAPPGETKPAPTPTPAAPTGGDREARVRDALVIGKTCTAALQDAGLPDREEALSVGQGVGAGTRYVYVLDPGNANAYAAFICLNGRITSVERSVPGR